MSNFEYGSRLVAATLAEQALSLLRQLQAAEIFLEDWPPRAETRSLSPQRLPVLDWLPALEMLAAPATRALVRDLVAAADALEWRQTYSAADFGARFLERYGWSELIGLRGPIASEAIACGFMMLGPEIEYPDHAHQAEELYLPLAGAALWRRDGGEYVLRPPGAMILHPTWTPHATKTLSEPLLALYVWRGGDLAAKSRIFGRL